jgi:2-oxoglutarate dehydrogenase complex dehydrogenase (E1) component-like enzyme
MGPWFFVRPLLTKLGKREPEYIGRVESASPATGSPESHKLEQQLMMDAAFGGADET